MYPGTKRKWIGLQPEVGNHLSLWYVLANNQTNRPYNFLKRAYKILQKPKHRKLKDRKYYERLIFLSFVSCQLVAKFILLTAGFRLSWGKTETKLKQGRGGWKTFSKGMVHRIIATMAVYKLGVKCFFGKKIFILTSFPWLLNLWTTRHKILTLISVVIKPVSVLAI